MARMSLSGMNPDAREAALTALINAEHNGSVTCFDLETFIRNARVAARLAQNALDNYREALPADVDEADSVLCYAMSNIESELAQLQSAWELARKSENASKSRVGA